MASAPAATSRFMPNSGEVCSHIGAPRSGVAWIVKQPYGQWIEVSIDHRVVREQRSLDFQKPVLVKEVPQHAQQLGARFRCPNWRSDRNRAGGRA